ncbi:MAG: DUF692 domain-containing protein [Alphaproteobacteria bacterium]|nr:DUF692 domain-containing protein [Alphaproteobacteria bacterium]
MSNPYPDLGFGLGLRAPHYEQVLREKPKVDFFEIISENYIDAHEGYWEYLADLRAHYPMIMHGVSMNIGSADPFNDDYFRKLKKLIDHLQPIWVSDHLCFTGLGGHNTHDLLPIPYVQESLQHVISRIHEAQEKLGRTLVIENPSTYLEFQASDIPEWEFLREVAKATGCGVLLDVNNVYVSSFNHGYDPKQYIDAIPADAIAQIHLAGHLNLGTHIIDTHDNHVIDAVWDLYAYTVANKGLHSTMIEWDDNIPAFNVLLAEINKARDVALRSTTNDDAHVLQRRA